MKKLILLSLTLLAGTSCFERTALASVNAVEMTAKTAENQIHQLIDPLIDRYCHESCKILSIRATVGIPESEKLAPGFDEDISPRSELVPSSAEMKLLIDDKIGPVSRRKLLDLLQQYLDSLEYPVHVNTETAHFPLPEGSEGKVLELRNRVSKSFQQTLSELLNQFCPQLCLLADFNLETDVVNGEETQYGLSGEYFQEGDTAIKIKGISATILMDQALTSEEQSNIMEMAKLKTSSFRHVTLNAKSMKFPQSLLSTGGEFDSTRLKFSGAKGSYGRNSESNSNSDHRKTDETNSKSNSEESTRSDSNNSSEKTNSQENNSKSSQESHNRFEKTERVENGDAVQAELQKFKVFGLIFSCVLFAMLIFIAMSTLRASTNANLAQRSGSGIDQAPTAHGLAHGHTLLGGSHPTRSEEANSTLAKKFEIDRLQAELSAVYAQQPRVAKHVFSKVLTEEGIEATAACIHTFGESILVEMLRDPGLQRDLAELLDFYSKNPLQLTDDEKLELLRGLHSRTVAGKLTLMGNLSSNLFEFLTDMDALQVMELVRTESLTVKAIILTQCDPQKRQNIYTHFTPDVRMALLTELTRIDYLPRDYIFNVAHALKRKRKDNPRLNTESLPGSDVLVSLLEQTSQSTQQDVIKNLEISNPESARIVKNKLVSLDTLRYLRDGQLLEVVLSLKYDELIQFLKGAPEQIRVAVLSRSPRDLVKELEEELSRMTSLSRESYHSAERKIFNRLKILANEGHINLLETNERMFSDASASRINGQFVASSAMNKTGRA